MSSITLKTLSKHFGELEAVDNLELEVPHGSFTALLGPSGCGKTTTMNMISGLEQPTTGEVFFDERAMSKVPIGDRNVGFVFQNYAIFTHMSVYDNLAFGLKSQRRKARVDKSEIDARVKDVAETVGLSAALDRPAARLSVNDLQKVALGRSMIMRPTIFLLDEPFSNLDSAFRAYMRAELKRIQHEVGQTMVYVTHDQVEAMGMADRIAVMDRGRLQQYGSPDDLYERPANTFVARFIGSVLNNFIPARYADGALQIGEGSIDLGERRGVFERRGSGSGLTATIRPERVRVVEAGSPEATIRASVTLVEPLGPEGRRAPRARRHRRARRAAAGRPPRDRQRARPRLRSGTGPRLRRRVRIGGALMARVRLEAVSKRFGSVTAMDDVTLDIADGEFFAILGPPGAGKTTTLRAILGLEKPDSGRVLLDDEDVTELWPGDRDIAIVFQNLALYPDKTVFGNLAFPLKQQKLPKAEIAERVQRAAKVLKIEPLLDRKPAKLSGGERQRVAIGRAIVRDPRAYLFDEPLSALDALLRLEMRSELKYLQRDLNRTLVYVTHDQVEAMSMADRMAVLRDGAVQQVATPEDIYHRPVNRFVATTIGSPPMNFLPATARRQNGSC